MLISAKVEDTLIQYLPRISNEFLSTSNFNTGVFKKNPDINVEISRSEATGTLNERTVCQAVFPLQISKQRSCPVKYILRTSIP